MVILFSACRNWPSSVWWRTSSATPRRRDPAATNRINVGPSSLQLATRNRIAKSKHYPKECHWPNARASRMSTSLADAPWAEWTELTLFKALVCLTWMLLIARKAIVILSYNHRREIAEPTSTVIDFSMQSNVTWAWNRLASLIIVKLQAVAVNGLQLDKKEQKQQLSGIHDKSNQLAVESSDPIRPEDRLLFWLLRRTASQCMDNELNWKSCFQTTRLKPSRVLVQLSSTANSSTSRTTLPAETAMLTHHLLSTPSHPKPSGAVVLVASTVLESVLATRTYFSASSSDTFSRKVSPLLSSHTGVMSRLWKLITNGFCTRKTAPNNRVGAAVEGDPAKEVWFLPSRLQPLIIRWPEERPSFTVSSIKANWPCIPMSNSEPDYYLWLFVDSVQIRFLKRKKKRVLIHLGIAKDEESIAGSSAKKRKMMKMFVSFEIFLESPVVAFYPHFFLTCNGWWYRTLYIYTNRAVWSARVQPCVTLIFFPFAPLQMHLTKKKKDL